MSRILIISHVPLTNSIAGPAARYLHFALELKKHFNVTILMPKSQEINDNLQNENIEIKSLTLTNILKYLNKVDSIIIHGLTLLKYPLLRFSKVPLIIDIYNAFLFENLEVRKKNKLWLQKLFYLADLFIIKDQLLVGDFFVCSNESQRNLWLGMLLSLGRINPLFYSNDKDSKGLLEIVPFGLETERPKKTQNVLKGVRKGIDKEDKLLIWNGGLWDWFDPITLIYSISEVIKERNDIKLVFLGAKTSENKNTSKAIQAISLSKELNILNEYVFFEDWIPYNERHNYLLEADLVVSTYYTNLETKYSMRTRMLDCIWTEIPMIVTKGDYFSDLISINNLGAVVEEQDILGLKESIIKILDNPKKIKEIKVNIKQIRHNYTWEKNINPIVEFCKKPKHRKNRKILSSIFYAYINAVLFYGLSRFFKILRMEESK